MEQPDVPEADVGPCAECPLELLNEYLQSPLGRVMTLVVEYIDFPLERGMTVTLDQMTYLEFLLLRVLGEEKQRLQNEDMEKGKRR